MDRVKPLRISPAQQRLLDKLDDGFVIVEHSYKRSLSYTVAQINPDIPWGLSRPKTVRRETVFALLALDVIEEFQPWQGYAAKAYRLSQEARP